MCLDGMFLRYLAPLITPTIYYTHSDMYIKNVTILLTNLEVKSAKNYVTS